MRALARATFHLRDARVFAGRRARNRARSTFVDAASDGGGGGVRFELRVARDSPAVEPSRLDAYVAANVDDASASRARGGGDQGGNGDAQWEDGVRAVESVKAGRRRRGRI